MARKFVIISSQRLLYLYFCFKYFSKCISLGWIVSYSLDMGWAKTNQGSPYHNVLLGTSGIGDRYGWYILVCWYVPLYHMSVHRYGSICIVSIADLYTGIKW